MRVRRWQWLAVMTVVPALALVAGCSARESERGDAGTASKASAPPSRTGEGSGAGQAVAGAATAPDQAVDQSAPAGGQAAAAGSPVRLQDPTDRIIREATLELDIDRGQLADKLSDAARIVARHRGTSASSSTSSPERGDASGRVTFRVPVQEYDATLADLKGLGRYRHERSDSQDVSGDVVDLGAQIVALRAQERTYLRLLGRAGRISDVLAVQGQLAQVRRDLERLEGQLRYLQDRSDFSTIELVLREPGAAAATRDRGTLARAWRVAVHGLEVGAAAVLVGLIWLVPIAALAALLAALLRLARRQRRPAPSAPAPGADG